MILGSKFQICLVRTQKKVFPTFSEPLKGNYIPISLMTSVLFFTVDNKCHDVSYLN